MKQKVKYLRPLTRQQMRERVSFFNEKFYQFNMDGSGNPNLDEFDFLGTAKHYYDCNGTALMTILEPSAMVFAGLIGEQSQQETHARAGIFIKPVNHTEWQLYMVGTDRKPKSTDNVIDGVNLDEDLFHVSDELILDLRHHHPLWEMLLFSICQLGARTPHLNMNFEAKDACLGGKSDGIRLGMIDSESLAISRVRAFVNMKMSTEDAKRLVALNILHHPVFHDVCEDLRKRTMLMNIIDVHVLDTRTESWIACVRNDGLLERYDFNTVSNDVQLWMAIPPAHEVWNVVRTHKLTKSPYTVDCAGFTYQAIKLGGVAYYRLVE